MAIGSMKYTIVARLLLAVALCLGVFGTACKKKAAADASQPPLTFASLPEATNVTAALDQKDYETAVSSLAKVKESISTEEQQKEYGVLLDHVKEKVVEAAGSDPKAAEALNTLRLMIIGR